MKENTRITESWDMEDFNRILNFNIGGTAVYCLQENVIQARYFSKSLPALSGFSEEEYTEIIRDNALNIVVENDRARVRMTIDEALDNHSALNTIFQIRHKTKGTIWVHASAIFVKQRNQTLMKAVFMKRAVETMLYQDIADQSTNGSYVISGHHKMLYINRQMEQILRKNGVKGEIIGKQCYEVVQNRTSPCPRCALSAQYPIEMSGDRSGHSYLVSSHDIVWNGTTAKVLYVNDVTEQKKAASEVERVYNNIPGAAFQCRFDADWTVLSANDGLYAFLGYTREEFAAMGNRMSAVIYPEDQSVMADKIGKQLVDGKTSIENENRLVCKDGTIKWISIKGQLLLDSDGENYFYCVFVDISKQKQETERVEREQKRYREIFDILGIAYWEWSATDGYYTSEKYSEYAIGAERCEEVWDKKLYPSFIHPDDVSLFEAFMRENNTDKQRKSAIIRAKMKDGSYRWSEMYTFAEHAPSGEPVRVVSVIRDVDKEWLEQKEKLQSALAEAKKANRAKTDFLSRVSHDMRTPLNGILGLTTLLKESMHSEKDRQDLQQLELSGKYLLNLINDTLDVSKIESGKLELHPVVCDGRAMFNNILSLAQPNLQAKNIQFRVKAEGLHFTTLYMDVGRVEQIVMNILGNAVKFTPEGGNIELTLTNLSVKQGVILDLVTIRDNGIGMSAEFLPHLFEPFSQEFQGRTSSFQGTGLGMTITKQIIELMGGEIHVESEVGKGTTFQFTLPMPMATEEQIREWKDVTVTELSDSILKGKRVLLCEDHPLNATIATRLLAGKGMLVQHAENGKIGVDLFRQSAENDYDVVLMDIRMPVMDGLEATQAIRALPRTDAREIPIIAMTANAFDEDVQQVKQAGMDAHLSKPIETAKLYQTLEEMLDSKNHRRRGDESECEA